MAFHTVLIVEDKPEIRLSARLILEKEGYQIVEADSPAAALALVNKLSIDAILLDMNFQSATTSGEEGLAFINEMRAANPNIPVIAMTAWSNTELVVKAMNAGARNFIEKPWNNKHLCHTLKQQIELSKLTERNAGLTQLVNREQSNLVAESECMRKLLKQIEMVANSDANILLLGENGSGKSKIAEFIHKLSDRKDFTFVTVNMGAVPESLFESEMFGHKKGAFTDAKAARIGRFSLADKGTLFMDEIDGIPLLQQIKLLRVLETRQFEPVGSSGTEVVNVRVISATNSELDNLIEQGEFRKDLYYRLNTIEFRIPPLRERLEDIQALAESFLESYKKKYRKNHLEFSTQALNALKVYPWPGNIRELSHVIERAVLLSEAQVISDKDLFVTSQSKSDELAVIPLEEMERKMILRALEITDGNKLRSAELLGITKSSLYRRLEKHGLEH